MSRAVVGILFAAALWSSVPRMTRLALDATRFFPLSPELRMERALGSYYTSILRIRAHLRPEEPVGLSTRLLERDIDGAIFANYYLSPNPTRLYATLDDWRTTVLIDPLQPKKLVRIDLGRTPEARLMTYLDIRAEEVSETRVVRDPKPGSVAFRECVVPIALAIDGQPGNAWVTEGVIVSDVDATATLTFFPGGESKTFALRARQPLILGDAVYAVASRLDIGWLRVGATAPVRAGFWYVNRGLAHAVSLPLFDGIPTLPQRVAGGEKLWILNPADRAVDVVVNGERHVVDAHALAALASAEHNVIAGEQPVLAFSARKQNGREMFQWPEGLR
jgi:hypothetical protein